MTQTVVFLRLRIAFLMLLVSSMLAGVNLFGQNSPFGVVATVPAGTQAFAAAVNVITNRVYVANLSGSVTVIDGATNAFLATVTTQDGSDALVVDPQTNLIYVTNGGQPRVHPGHTNSVSVIDGSNNTLVGNVSVGDTPRGIALNPVTHQVYVTNFGSTGVNGVSIINGQDKTTAVAAPTTVAAGKQPYSVAINSVTNKIYVGNQAGNTVTVINANSNNAITTINNAGNSPSAIAVNAVTNRIYLSNGLSASGGSPGTVDVINGSTDTIASQINAGNNPSAVAVNPVTNQIYVANGNDTTATVIDGDTNVAITVPEGSGSQSFAMALNSVTNKVYIGNAGSNTMTVIDGTNLATTPATVTLPAGSQPIAVAINSVTNKIYVVNVGTGNVSVIDGATNGTKIVAQVQFAISATVNPVTNKVYVTSGGDANGNLPGTLKVVDGTSDTITNSVNVANAPYSAVVNPVTNKIYVTNFTSNNVSVVDGTTNTVIATVPAGMYPWKIAVNPVTNKIYVANQLSNDVTIIDGATNTTTSVSTGTTPYDVAVDQTRNRIYVANAGNHTVTVIDGVTGGVIASVYPVFLANALAVNPVTNKVYVVTGSGALIVIDGQNLAAVPPFIATPDTTQAVAVNIVTNRIYVSDRSNGISIIDGTTNQVITRLNVGIAASSIAVNLATNKIYAVDQFKGPNMAVIDGATNTFVTIPINSNMPIAAVVNPVMNKTYVVGNGFPNNINTTLTRLSESNTQDVKLNTTIQPDTTDPLIIGFPPAQAMVTSNPTPRFMFTADSNFTPAPPPAITGVFYQVDTWQGPWIPAGSVNGSATNYAATIASPLRVGEHILYAFAQDRNPETTSSFDDGQRIGNIQALYFVIVPVGTITSLISDHPNGVLAGSNVTFTATVKDAAGNLVPGGTVQFYADGVPINGPVNVMNGVAMLTIDTLTAGTHAITATYIPVAGYFGSTGSLQQLVIGPASSIVVKGGSNQSATVNTQFAQALTVEVLDANMVPVPGVAITYTVTPSGGGASATLSTPAVTGVDGQTSVIATANGTPGSFSATAAIAGSPSISASFGLTNVLLSSTTQLTANGQTSITVMYGDTVTLAAAVTPVTATGSVEFILQGTSTILGAAALSNGITTLNVSSLAANTYTIVAQYGGDGTHGGSDSNSVTVVVAKKTAPGGGAALTLKVNDAKRSFGEQNPAFTYAVTGTLVNNDTTATAVTGTPNFATTAAVNSPPGPYQVSVNGLSSANYVIAFLPGTLTVTAVKSPVVIEVGPTTPPYGGPVDIDDRSGDPTNPNTPTGTVAVIIDGGPPMTLPIDNNGHTQLPGNLPPGPHTIEVMYPGDGNFNPGMVVGTITVQQAPTSTTVTSNNPIASLGQPIVFTATVASGTTGTPTGTVTFFADGITIGTTTLNSNSVATLSISTLMTGTHNIVAVYNGNANFLGSSSSTLSQVVSADFAIANKTPPQIIPPGASASFAIAITSVSTPFTSLVTLTATNLPPGATYTYTPPTVTPGASGATSTFTVTVPRQAADLHRSSKAPMILAALLLPFVCLKRYRDKPQWPLVWILIAFTSFTAMTGCGVGGYFSQTQQTYTITVTGTSGSLSHSTTATLTVE